VNRINHHPRTKGREERHKEKRIVLKQGTERKKRRSTYEEESLGWPALVQKTKDTPHGIAEGCPWSKGESGGKGSPRDPARGGPDLVQGGGGANLGGGEEQKSEAPRKAVP